MGIELRLPQINGKTDREQLAQIKSYLYQMAQQLQWALNNVSQSSGNVVVQKPSGSTSALPTDAAAQTTFNAIKSMIIKSADIVNAYYQEISRRLDGEYVARSDFGSYTERTSQEINENSTGIERLFTNVQTIVSDLETLQYSIIETNAHINSGLLYYDESGIPIYGLEQKRIYVCFVLNFLRTKFTRSVPTAVPIPIGKRRASFKSFEPKRKTAM